MKVLAEERQQHILQMLKENNVVKIKEIRKQTNVLSHRLGAIFSFWKKRAC